ncbi:MAG: hypothetical protein WD068_01950 [Candidatus Babeliales bacterium]
MNSNSKISSSPLNPSNKPFAEIIESSLHNFKAQSWEWDIMPSFGSLIMVESDRRKIFGLVHDIQTGSMDPVRSPFPYKKTYAELKAEQPQIFEFLKTSFICINLGYQEKGTIYYTLCPEPPKIHSFIHPVDRELYQQFFASEQFLHLLFGVAHQIINIDELLLAIIRNLAQMELLSDVKINKLIEAFSLLTGNDYRRLKLFLGRAEKILGRYTS